MLKSTDRLHQVKRTPYLPGLLTEAARRTKRLACLHPFASYAADLSPDLEIFHKIAQRIPGVAIEDRTQLLPSMRAVKSPAELALIERAVVGHRGRLRRHASRALKPGHEREGPRGPAPRDLPRPGLRARLRAHRRRRSQRHDPSLQRQQRHHRRRRPDRHGLRGLLSRLRLGCHPHAARLRGLLGRAAGDLRGGAGSRTGGHRRGQTGRHVHRGRQQPPARSSRRPATATPSSTAPATRWASKCTTSPPTAR